LNCTVTSVTLSGSSSTAGAQFNWSTANGNIVSGADTATPVANKAGTYILTVTSPNGCTATDSVVVTVAATVPVAITSQVQGGSRCVGQSITFSVTAGGASSIDVPMLHIRTEAGQTVLSWPSAAGLFSLQSRDSLSGGSGWMAVTNVPVVNGSAYEVRVVMSGNHF